MSAPVTVMLRSSDEAFGLGQKIGELLQTPMVLTLKGDLGCGKTVLAQGLARGLGVPKDQYVTSPTFTLINEYSGRLPFFHIDLYRLTACEELDDLGMTEIMAADAVVAVEWPEILAKWPLGDHLALAISFAGDNSRRLTINAYGPGPLNLLKEIAKSNLGVN